jgi:hypothetical protein
VVEVIETGADAEGSRDFGPNASAVAEMIERARHLTPSQAHALAGAVAWRWVPLTIPGSGTVVAARAEATAAARGAGRDAALAAAEADARRAASDSPGGQSVVGRWSWAENGLVAVGAGIIGALAFAGAGQALVAGLFGLVAMAGAVVLLLFESRSVTRTRLLAGVGAAAVALAVRDLLDPRAFEALHGPWATVMRD